MLRKLIHEDEGATAIEYSLISFLIAAAIIGAVFALGVSVSTLFNDTAEAFPGL